MVFLFCFFRTGGVPELHQGAAGEREQAVYLRNQRLHPHLHQPDGKDDHFPFVLYLCLQERRPCPEASPEASDKTNMSFLTTVGARICSVLAHFFISAAQMHVEVFTR